MIFIRSSVLYLIAGMTAHGVVAYAATPRNPGADAIPFLGAPLPAEALQTARARGELVVSAASNGTVGQNTVGSGSVTGTITDTQSIANTSGFTTVQQNTGNNALLQNSTSIYISAK